MSSKRALFAFLAFLLYYAVPSGATAQTTCTTANYYNSLFHAGCLSFTDLNNSWASPPILGSVRPNSANFLNVTVAGALITQGAFSVPLSTTSGAGFIIPPGTAPTSPANGSVWTTSSGMYVQINGGTIGPLGTGGGGGGGSPGGATNSVQLNSGAGTLAGASLTAGQLLIGQSSAAPTGVTLGGDCTITTAGVITCTKSNGVNLGALATLSTVTVATGGTGLASGTSGAVPYFNATNTMASSALLTANALMLGGGAGAAPKVMASLGTSVQTLHGNAGGLPTWGPVNLATDVTSNLSVGNLNSGTAASNTTFWRGDGIWATPAGGGGGSLTVTDGTTPIANVTSLTLAGFVTSGSAGLATAKPTASDVTSNANYTVAAIDMGGVRNMNGTSLVLTIPAISSTVFAAGMQSTFCNFNATAVTLTSTPTLNGYPASIPGVVNSVANCVAFSSNGTSLDAFPGRYSLNQLQSNIVAQTFTGGIRPTAFSIGTVTTGTTTVDCGNGPIQTMTNGGASTIAVAAFDGSCVLRITNNASAGAITFSGFSQGSNSGDSLTTTNTSKFDVYFNRIGGNPHYQASALQ